MEKTIDLKDLSTSMESQSITAKYPENDETSHGKKTSETDNRRSKFSKLGFIIWKEILGQATCNLNLD